jgi:hypothetical protein
MRSKLDIFLYKFIYLALSAELAVVGSVDEAEGHLAERIGIIIMFIH